MAKIKVRKDVMEQIVSKLKTPKNGLERANSVKKVTNFNDTSKLQANKNVFSRGDFDEYKISDEELKALYGQTADGQIYDLTDPTENFYYDLKTKFDEAELLVKSSK